MGALLPESRRRTPGGRASEALSRLLAASPLAHRQPRVPLRFCHLCQDPPQLRKSLVIGTFLSLISLITPGDQKPDGLYVYTPIRTRYRLGHFVTAG